MKIQIPQPSVQSHASWFSSPERIAALEFKAGKWIGTPFLANSNMPGPGGGVSCQKLVSAIYREVGFCDVPVPEVAMSHAQFSQRSLVEEFMADRPEFVRIEKSEVMPGDLLGFRIGKIVHHLGIVLPASMFIHAMYRHGTICSALSDGTWVSRLRAVWRPLTRGAA